MPAPWMRLTANLQWINPANGAYPTPLLGGARLRVAF